jgi:hypothetical protein
MDEDDEYNETFSDFGNEEGDNYGNDRNNDDDDDEQHAQHTNSRVETLEMRVDELEREITEEKSMHEMTRKALNDANDNIGFLQAEVYKPKALGNDVDTDTFDLPSYVESQGETIDLPGAISLSLKDEVVSFCSKFALQVGVEDVHGVNNDTIIAALQMASQYINVLQRRQPGSTTGGTMSASESEMRVKNLESELRLALGANEDIRALKAKVLQMMERTRVEKELKLKAELDGLELRKKMEILGDHIEKLMMNLRHEATAKIKALEALRNSETNVNQWKDKIDALTKKVIVKDRLIMELHEGGRVLEDQLRLMDEKYLELRAKLDWARENGMRRIKKAEKVAKDLRMRFIMQGGKGLLDNAGMSRSDLDGDSFASQSHVEDGIGLGAHSEASLTASFPSGKRGSGRLVRLKSVHDDNGTPQKRITYEGVTEKLRRKQGEKMEITDEKIQKLLKRR